MEIVVAVDEYTVIAWHSLEPRRGCPNNFVMHAIDVAWIGGGRKRRDCTVEHVDTTGISFAFVVGVFMISTVIQLSTEKVADELRKDG